MDSSISIYPLQNVQAGSTVSIRWTYSGTQISPFELGVTNTKTSADTILDNDVDLTKGSEPWMITVAGGSYKLFLRNLDNPASTYYSTVFTISTQNTQSPNTDQSEGNNISLLT
ncbi:38527_t:CDS:2 [Gigaspora margarita]|uniref:38527_t:CDS:1 n=1 Tax=Gigaspora margarita TaxID=4874 RepID=A0ABM8W2B9_GIGMA|nr:38527_t:CDS:2 [Gigaspora margarita]